MENPFVKLVREGEEPLMEKEKLVEFSSEDGKLIWRKRKGQVNWNVEYDVMVGTPEARKRMKEIEEKTAEENK